ncbi:MAG: hypothetical protein ACE3JK_10470 [Sporolactobacillus sp.]
MAIYLVTYDSHETNSQKYKKLANRLAAMGGKRVLKSTWLVPYQFDSKDLYESLICPITNPDEVIIAAIADDAKFALGGTHLKNSKSMFN